MNGKNILVVSPEPWDHLFVSKHHYAIQLGKRGNKVFFLGPPEKYFEIQESNFDNLSIVSYSGFTKGLRYFPGAFRKKQTKKVWEQLQELCGVFFDIIWSFDNSVFYDFDSLPDSVLKISHIVDLNQDFQTARAAKTASVCFGVIPEIVSSLKKFNPKSFCIRHGVSIPEKLPSKIMLPGQNEKKVLYAGNLSMPHIDWDLFLEATEKFDKTDFIFIGSNNDSKRGSVKWKVLQRRNVYFIERVNSDKLRDYLFSADVLVVAYNSDYYKNYASPHKIMEYLAVGKPIVSTYSSDLALQSDIIYLAEDRGLWIDFLEKAIHNDRKSLVKKRVDFALNNTYNKQIQRIEAYISQLDIM